MSLFLKLKCPVLGSFRLKLILAPPLGLEKFLTLVSYTIFFHSMLDPDQKIRNFLTNKENSSKEEGMS